MDSNGVNDSVNEKQEFSPSNDVNHDNNVNDTYQVPKQSSLKPFTLLLPFPQRMAKAKPDL